LLIRRSWLVLITVESERMLSNRSEEVKTGNKQFATKKWQKCFEFRAADTRKTYFEGLACFDLSFCTLQQRHALPTADHASRRSLRKVPCKATASFGAKDSLPQLDMTLWSFWHTPATLTIYTALAKFCRPAVLASLHGCCIHLAAIKDVHFLAGQRLRRWLIASESEKESSCPRLSRKLLQTVRTPLS